MGVLTTWPRPSITSQTIAVEHIRISSGRPFAEVRRKLEDTLPKLDASIADVLRSGDQRRQQEYEENGSLRVGRRATCLLRLYVFNLNNALYSTRPYNEGRRFQCQLIAFNARIEYAIVPGESLI